MAVLGKKVIHPGGRRSTAEMFAMAEFQPEHRVLDVGAGVGTTAIEIARTYGCEVTAIDIDPLMRARALRNVRNANLESKVSVRAGNIQAFDCADAVFDRVVVEAVTMFVDRKRAAREVVRVCRPGGIVLEPSSFTGNRLHKRSGKFSSARSARGSASIQPKIGLSFIKPLV